MKWAEPETVPVFGDRSRAKEMLVELEKQPGRWAEWKAYRTRRSASFMACYLRRKYGYSGQFEFRLGKGTEVYARFMGEPEAGSL